MDFREIGCECVDWIQLVQKRVQWQSNYKLLKKDHGIMFVSLLHSILSYSDKRFSRCFSPSLVWISGVQKRSMYTVVSLLGNSLIHKPITDWSKRIHIRLTNWSRVLENLTITRPLKKYPYFYRTLRFFTMFTRPPPLVVILSQINPVHTLSTYFFKIYSITILPSTPRSYEYLLTLFPSGFPTKILNTFLNSPCVLHYTTIPSSLLPPPRQCVCVCVYDCHNE